MKFINTTKHPITVVTEAKTITFEPSGDEVRVSTESRKVDTLSGIDVFQTSYGQIEGLPDPQSGVVFIVSTLVLLALKDQNIIRDDLVAPDTSPDSVIRDESGKIVGVKRFQVV